MEPILHRGFKKQFKKLPPEIQDKFFERVKLFLTDRYHPLLNHHSVDAAYPGWWSINITGDYRALYEPKDNNIAVFMKIGMHSELYG